MWGSWHKVSRSASAELCVQRHRFELADRFALLDEIVGLEGATLRCHCDVGSPCHADNLVEMFVKVFQPLPPPAADSCVEVTADRVGRLRR